MTTSSTSPEASSSTAKTYTATFEPTGFRRGFTEEDAIPLEAPVKRRRYLVSSRTAARDTPDFSMQDASSDESVSPAVSPPMEIGSGERCDVRVDDRPPRDKVARQRLNNTLSARRSRARKLETLEILRREKAELEHVVKEKDAVLTRALEETARYKSVVEELNEQLTLKSSLSIELEEANDHLLKELLAIRTERDSLLARIGL